MTETDGELVARTLAGEVTAYETLVHRHFRAILAIARAHVGNDADAEDLCQTALFRAYERLADCSHPERFGAWLGRIARNQAINWRRREEVRTTIPLGEHVAAPAATPDVAAVHQERRAMLAHALETLAPIHREVVVLHDLHGEPHAVIAQMLGISELMSRRHLSDARKRLRIILGPEWRNDDAAR